MEIDKSLYGNTKKITTHEGDLNKALHDNLSNYEAKIEEKYNDFIFKVKMRFFFLCYLVF